MNILLADDHQLVRDGIILILKQLGSDVVIYEADSYQRVFEILGKSIEFELLIIDINMPGESPCQSIKFIKKICPSIPIVILSSTEDIDVINSLLTIGVSGYITKLMSSEVVLRALQLILSGEIYIPTTLLHYLFKVSQAPNAISSEISSKDIEVHEIPSLTKRQREVLSLVSAGDSDKMIGNKLNISETTVRTHTANIYKLLNVKNRTQASRVAADIGILK